MNIKPQNTKVMLTMEKAVEATASGIIIPAAAQEKKTSIGKVVYVGPMVEVVLPGDMVIFAEYGFDPVTIDKVEYWVGPEDQVLAILE